MGAGFSRPPFHSPVIRCTLGIIRQSITVSLAAKAGFVLFTLAGVLSKWAAVTADTDVSLLVVANALRLLRVRRRTQSGWYPC